MAEKNQLKIALKINRHLKANKLSQKGLAEMLDVSPQQINKILMGRRKFEA